MSSHQTIVTFEGTRHGDPNSGYAVVQRGRAKKIVSRATGQAILDGRETIRFKDDTSTITYNGGRKTRRVTKKRTSRNTLERMRLAVGSREDDESIVECECKGKRPNCSQCRGIGYIVQVL